MADDKGRRSDDDKRSAAAEPTESGPLRGGKPVEPTPASRTQHPTPKAEERSEEIRKGGEPESSDDR